MNVFRISNNQRIISTPSAFKSMDPSRLERHFDWESKSFLPLDTKDNEGAAFSTIVFFFIVASTCEGTVSRKSSVQICH